MTGITSLRGVVVTLEGGGDVVVREVFSDAGAGFPWVGGGIAAVAVDNTGKGERVGRGGGDVVAGFAEEESRGGDGGDGGGGGGADDVGGGGGGGGGDKGDGKLAW